MATHRHVAPTFSGALLPEFWFNLHEWQIRKKSTLYPHAHGIVADDPTRCAFFPVLPLLICMPNRRLPVSWIQIRSFFTIMGTFLPRSCFVSRCLNFSWPWKFIIFKIYINSYHMSCMHILNHSNLWDNILKKYLVPYWSHKTEQNKANEDKTSRCVGQTRTNVCLMVLKTIVITQATVWWASMSSRQTNIYERMDRLDMQTEEYKGKTMVGTAITNFKYDYQNSEIFT